jgi:hypothetical protein
VPALLGVISKNETRGASRGRSETASPKRAAEGERKAKAA